MFWTKYAELCHAKDESPNYVAAKIGVKSTGTVSGWKKGAVPRDGVLSAIAHYFDMPVSYFFEDEKMPIPVNGNEHDIKAFVYSLNRDELLECIMYATGRLKELE